MAKNSNLHAAKKAKNDEWYTRLEDIENELKHYKDHFKGKVVFCNCDDPEESNFWKYFQLNFDFLGLKKLISTHFDDEKPSYKLELVGDVDGDGKVTKKDIIKTPLKQNGDFRSPECIEILQEADIVVTNPPFSLFREYIAQLVEYDKKFVILGNNNVVINKDIFPLIRDNKIWIGNKSMSTDMLFIVPDDFKKYLLDNKKEGSGYKIIDGNFYGRANAIWFTNLDIKKRHEDLLLYRNYTPYDYPEFDNYNAINVNKVKDIPMDYYGVIGAPITFLDNYNPKQFEILGMTNNTKDNAYALKNDTVGYSTWASIGGKNIYARILIKRKQNNADNT